MAILCGSRLATPNQIGAAASAGFSDLRGATARSRISMALKASPRSHLHHALSSVLDRSSPFLHLQWWLKPRGKNMYDRMPVSVIVRAVFVVQWIEQICRFLKATPAKLFLQKAEDDIDKAAKVIEVGAEAVKEIAERIDEAAERVEKGAQQAEALADKVETTTKHVEESADEVFRLLEGNKKVVVTKYKVVGKKKEMEDTSSKEEAKKTKQEGMPKDPSES